MADKNLQSMTFPQLGNKYLVPQIDATLSQSGYAADAKETGDALETKAEIDGYYEEMTVGDAEQLVATQYIEDSVPYLYRTSGGSADIGNREYDEIVGGSVVWNQLFNSVDYTNTLADTRNVLYLMVQATSPVATVWEKYINNTGIITTIFNAQSDYSDFRLKHNGASTDFNFVRNTNDKLYANHKYFLSANFTGIDPTTVGGVVGKDFMLIDLTKMLGSSVADYLYTLESATAGAGVALFRKMFPNDYYEYNVGEMMHVSGISAHEMVGFNQWDEEWELGWINESGENVSASSIIRSKNYIPVIPNTQYFFNYPYTGTVNYYNANKTCLGQNDKNNLRDVGSGGAIRTTPDNCHYVRIWVRNQTTYNHDICINLSWSGTRNGEYEPYVKHSYPLDDSLTLRGIPKLDASNNLYYDGDTYAADGTVTRRYGIVDLGTLNWTYYSSGTIFYAVVPNRFANGKNGSGICTKYVFYGTTTESNIIANMPDKNFGFTSTSGATYIELKDSAYTDASAFKTAISGVYLVYELATPTTEASEPYNEVQIVDDWGTEEYVSTSIVPVGHVTKYPQNLRDKLQHLPNLASADGVYAIQQSGSQMSLTHIPTAVSELPDAPTTDGTYTLKATVSNGTVTYTWEAE